jgi:hypothetical protein
MTHDVGAYMDFVGTGIRKLLQYASALPSPGGHVSLGH